MSPSSTTRAANWTWAPAYASPEKSNGACYTNAPNLSTQARTKRATLGSALSTANLINYGTESWHWSVGDRYWAQHTQQPTRPQRPATNCRPATCSTSPARGLSSSGRAGLPQTH
ncbi:hypothetical protein [Streptomyces sp. NPDC127036]|uniref:hypothetical protein n=1 Tax=Streptomyces sp. NPDC127036 TaxID=3347112 RepID=UPI00364A0A72